MPRDRICTLAMSAENMQGGKGKGPAKTQENVEPEMSKEELVENIERLKKELDKEKEERNYFQLERDRIYTFWENTQKEQLELQAEIKNLDKDIEQDEMQHQVEIKVYKDKMKFLVCEHQDMISKLTADSLVAAKARQNEQEKLETELLKGMKAIMVDMEEINNENIVKELEVKHENEMTAMRDRLEKQLADTEDVYKAKMMSLQQELDTMRANEICETEDYWNNHIDALKAEHNNDLNDVSKVVKEIQRVMDRNEALKDQIKDMKKKQKQKENDLIPVLQEKKHLTELLSKAEEEIAEMEKMMKHSTTEKDKNEIIFDKKLTDLDKEHEALKGKLRKLEQERDDLYRTHTDMIQTIQEKADLKTQELKSKLDLLSDRLKKTDVQLHSVLTAPNMDQTALCDVMNKTQGALDFSNDTIRILQNKVDQITKAREDLLLSYKTKLRVLGVPEEDLHAGLFESSHADKGPDQFLDLGFALK